MNKQTWPKTLIGIILSILVLVVAQLAAQLTGELLAALSVPVIIVAVIASALYPVLAVTGIRLIICKGFKTEKETIRLTRFKPALRWFVIAVIMPVLAIGSYFFFSGELTRSPLSSQDLIPSIVYSVGFYSIAAGIVEELVFRGVIMGLLEKKTNFAVACIIPSVLFGLLHIIGNELSFRSIIQLAIAGTIVGILFSLIAKYTGSIWEGAIVHGIWNAAAYIIAIGNTTSDGSIFTYVLNSRSFLLTGGDFGMEASVNSIAAYAVIIAAVAVMMAKKKKTAIGNS